MWGHVDGNYVADAVGYRVVAVDSPDSLGKAVLPDDIRMAMSAVKSVKKKGDLQKNDGGKDIGTGLPANHVFREVRDEIKTFVETLPDILENFSKQS